MIKDENHLPTVMRNIKEYCSKTVEVGVFGDDNSEMPMIFHVQEFGAKIKVTPKMRWYLGALGLHLKKDTTVVNVPERSTLRKAFNNTANVDACFTVAGNVYDINKDAMQGLDAMGVKMADFVKKNIASNTPPPNHPFTTAQKGGKEKTLINHGVLLNSVRHEVV